MGDQVQPGTAVWRIHAWPFGLCDGVTMLFGPRFAFVQPVLDGVFVGLIRKQIALGRSVIPDADVISPRNGVACIAAGVDAAEALRWTQLGGIHESEGSDCCFDCSPGIGLRLGRKSKNQMVRAFCSRPCKTPGTRMNAGYLG